MFRKKPAPAQTVPGAARAAGASAPGTPAASEGPQGALYGAGLTFAFAAAALVGGMGLVFGADALMATAWAMLSFVAVGLAGWVAEMCLGPALARIAQERTQPGTPAGAQLAPATVPVAEPFRDLTAVAGRAPAA